MERIKTENREIDKFGPGKDGFRAAVPGVSAPTYLSAEFFNGLQESLMRVQEEAGLSPSPDFNQLCLALKIIVERLNLIYPDGSTDFSRTMQDKILEFPSVDDFQAVGDGVTNNAAAFVKMEAHSSPEFYVPHGYSYQSGLNSLKKRYYGPGNVLLANGSGAPGISSSAAIVKSSGLDANTGRHFGVTQEVFITDSIGFGFGVPVEKSPIYLVQEMLNSRMAFGQGNYLSGANLERIGTTGAVTVGTAGPLRRSRIMSPGSTVFFSADHINYLSFHFERTPAAGTITVKRAGVNISVNNCSGSPESDVFSPSSWPNIAAAGKGVIYTLECSGAPVEITGIFAVHLPDTSRQNPVMIQYQGMPGASMADFLDIDAEGAISPTSRPIVAIKRQIFYGNFFPRIHLMLGTNGIFNTGKQVPVEMYRQHLIALITQFAPLSTRMVLYVPLRAGNGAYVPAYAAFEAYRTAIYEIARSFNLDVIDQSELDLMSIGAYQDDQLHPNEYGYAALGAFLFKKLFGHICTEPRHTADFVFAPGVSPSAELSTPQVTMSAGAMVVVQGGLALSSTISGIPKGSNIINMPPAFAPVKPEIFTVTTLNAGGVAGTATLSISNAASIRLLDYSDPTATQLFLGGVNYCCA